MIIAPPPNPASERQARSHGALAAVAMSAFIVAYSPTPPVIMRRAPHRSARNPEPSWPIAFVTANELVSRPSTNGGAPSSVAYSGRSGSMTAMPTWLMKPMKARTQRAGSIAPATRRTRELSAMSGGALRR